MCATPKLCHIDRVDSISTAHRSRIDRASTGIDRHRPRIDSV